MGEWKVQVPVKLDAHTVAQLDLLRAAYPFKPGRSTVIRELVEEGLRLIAEGIMQFRATTSNRVPSVQSVPGTPQVSAAFPGEQKKPLVRVGPSKTGSHQRRDFAFNGSTAVSANVAFVTSRIHSTRVSGVAA